ncbi:OmpL47-type beta-barrel domain-containing protein [Parabacteroides timonensis]|uniref:OmpL47-type beta-barrel domain-containing protein n=1 Tax=Parabacteroides timonensis TaxID=1871013 RepID=UPI001115126B|nr:InlB B-repeat-containing protein [Parabacteroides timonensis]
MSKYYKNRITGMGAWVVAFLFLCLPVSWGEETEEIKETFYVDDKSVVIEESGTYRITQRDLSKTTGNNITVKTGLTVTIYLRDVNIESSSCPFDIQGDASVNLWLEGVNKLKATGDYNNHPALRCEGSASLEIDGAGELTATGCDYGAGIGGGQYGSGGTITINGGVVTAMGDYGAGIGGGYTGFGGGYKGGSGGTITINGGVVTATSTDKGAGIGGGRYGSGGIITIRGGVVTATGDGGAGIGGGYGDSDGDGYGDSGIITIDGGVVTAESKYGAGIGGGNRGAGETITIEGGVVTATSKNGAGIGGGGRVSATGVGGAGGTITIEGGFVTATSTDGGAGIGGGFDAAAGTFSTGESGNAFIIASSIGNDDNTDAWSGVILKGTYSGKVYGNPTSLPEGVITIPEGKNLEVEADKTLTIGEGTTLILEEGAKVTNKGKITNNGVLAVAGTLEKGGGSLSDTEELGNLYKLDNGTITGYSCVEGVLLTFDGNGGYIDYREQKQVVAAKGGEVTAPTELWRPGYTFAWWSSADNDRTEVLLSSEANNTYYAVWKYNPTISVTGQDASYTYGDELDIKVKGKVWNDGGEIEWVDITPADLPKNADDHSEAFSWQDDYNTELSTTIEYEIAPKNLTLNIPKQELYSGEELYYTVGENELVGSEKPIFKDLQTGKVTDSNISDEGENRFNKSNYDITLPQENGEVTVNELTLVEAYAAEAEELAEPVDGWHKEGEIFTLTPSEGFQISATEGEWAESVTLSSPYTYYLKRIRNIDEVDNRTASSGLQTLPVQIDKTAPAIEIKQLDGLNVSVTITDDESGVASYTYQWDEGASESVAYTGEPITLTAPSYGKHKLTVTAIDNVGNTCSLEEEQLTFEKPRYKITLATDITGGTIGADKGEAAADETVTLSYTEHTNYDFAGWTVTNTGGDETVSVDGNNQFIMPDYAVTVSASFRYNPPYVPEPTPVYYTVTLPAVEGATTDPAAGEYEVESWGSFGFYLTLAADYDQSKPVVSTSCGETIEPRASDGKYVIRYVRSDLEIRIDGIQKNPDPVANERIEAETIEVRGGEGCLYLRLGMRREVYVYTFTGSLIRRFEAAPNDSRWTLPEGNYIVQVDDKVYKVRVR